MSIRKIIISMLEEYIKSKKASFGLRPYICFKCCKMELLRSRPSKKGCPDGEHKWKIMDVKYQV